MAAPPKKSGIIKNKTATLNGQHDKTKVLWRFGVTESVILRDKALKRLGGSEETFQQTNEFLARNQNAHAPTASQILAAHNHHQQQINRKDPLELEYTQNSQTQETINQSTLAVSRRSSGSYSLTWNSQNPPPKS